jgi:superfamily II DNA or RNA helicase
MIDINEFYGDKELRWFQIAARNQTNMALAEGKKRILITIPTGGGKTLTIACTICSDELKHILNVHDRPLRVLFIAHNHRLLTQAEKTFIKDSDIELTLQSMMSEIPEKVIKKGWDIAILDEAHHESCLSMQYHLENMNAPLIGLTATQDRNDGMMLKFDAFVEPITRSEAVEQGYLASTYLNTFVDGSERSKVEIIKDILDNYAHEMNGTIIFVRTKVEVAQIADYIIKLGYPAVGLLEQSHTEVDNILNSFSDGHVQFLVCCQKLSEGIDVKGCHSVVIGRTVASYQLLNQMIGRASRPDCPCHIYEIVDPLSKDNIDTTAVVGIPESHKLIYFSRGKWCEEYFDYTRV